MIAPQALREKLKSHIKDHHDPLLGKPYLQHTIDIMEKISDFHQAYLDYQEYLDYRYHGDYQEYLEDRGLPLQCHYLTFVELLAMAALWSEGRWAARPRGPSAGFREQFALLAGWIVLLEAMVHQNPLRPHGRQPLCYPPSGEV